MSMITTTLCSLQQCSNKMSYLNQMYEKKAMAHAWAFAWLVLLVTNAWNGSVVVVVAHIYPPVTGQRQMLTYWTIRTLFITVIAFVIGGIRTCLGVSDDLMFLWISSNSCLLNLLLVGNHQAEIIIVKRLIQGRNNVTRVRVEPRLFDQGRRKNDAFTHSATLPTFIHSATLFKAYGV